MISELENLRNNINVDFNNTYNIVSGYTTDLINLFSLSECIATIKGYPEEAEEYHYIVKDLEETENEFSVVKETAMNSYRLANNQDHFLMELFIAYNNFTINEYGHYYNFESFLDDFRKEKISIAFTCTDYIGSIEFSDYKDIQINHNGDNAFIIECEGRYFKATESIQDLITDLSADYDSLLSGILANAEEIY